MKEWIDIESVEKALRGDKRFDHLLKEDVEQVLWQMFAILEEHGIYNSYLGDGAFEFVFDTNEILRELRGK